MTTDLDQDIYKDDYEFMNDQLMQFNEKDKLPMPSTEEFKGVYIYIVRLQSRWQYTVGAKYQNSTGRHIPNMAQVCQTSQITIVSLLCRT